MARVFTPAPRSVLRSSFDDVRNQTWLWTESGVFAAATVVIMLVADRVSEHGGPSLLQMVGTLLASTTVFAGLRLTLCHPHTGDRSAEADLQRTMSLALAALAGSSVQAILSNVAMESAGGVIAVAILNTAHLFRNRYALPWLGSAGQEPPITSDLMQLGVEPPIFGTDAVPDGLSRHTSRESGGDTGGERSSANHEDLSYGIVVTDATTRVLAVNTAAQTAFGDAPHLRTGRRLCKGATGCACPVHTALRSGLPQQASSAELVGERNDDRAVPVMLWPVREDATSIALFVTVDTGGSDRPGEDGVETISRMSAMISHELRGPLATMRAVSELALDDDLTADERRDLLLRMSRQVLRLDTMVHQLVEAFRIRSGQYLLNRERLNMREICNEVLVEVAETRPEHHIHVLCDPDLPEVDADRLKVRTILSNLLRNACKYSPPGTLVVVEVRPAGNDVHVSVRDQGPGIPPEHLPNLFSRFFRVPAGGAQPGGLGLGLFIVRELAEAHGGRVWVESTPGSGSCFTVALPRALRGAAAPERAATWGSAA